MRALLVAAILAVSCASDQDTDQCEWPAGRDMVDPRTGEKGVFLTEPEWQQLWECNAARP